MLVALRISVMNNTILVWSIGIMYKTVHLSINQVSFLL